MSVKVNDNSLKISLDITRRASLSLRYMTDDLLTLSTPNTPRKQGDLRRNVLKQVTGLSAKVIWSQKYASRLETKQFSNYTTPGTGSKFAYNAAKSISNSPQGAFKKARLI